MVRRLATALGIAAIAAAVAACGDQKPAASEGTINTKVVTSTQRASHPTPRASHTTPHGGHTTAFAEVPLTGSGHTIRIPRCWHASVWAHVDDARLETWTPQASLLISSPNDGIVTELTPHAGAAPTARTIISGLTNPQGLAFDRLGGHEYLYVASSNELDRYTWTGGEATAHTVLVPGLPDTQPAGDDVHRLKNVVVGHDHTLYVDIGSSSNASVPPPVPKGGYPRAAVLAFHPTFLTGSTLPARWASGAVVAGHGSGIVSRRARRSSTGWRGTRRIRRWAAPPCSSRAFRSLTAAAGAGCLMPWPGPTARST